MELTSALGIATTCSGASTHEWLDVNTGKLPSINPSNGEQLGLIKTCSMADYETIMTASIHAQKHWRTVPAPQRGELVRCLGNALREKKDLLGSLIALEMGKIKQEGDGEVQEMIDIADMAVGQSRMLYGKTMHSERVQHRMYEQWHPLGVVGVISAFNFPMAVWAWNACIAAIAGNTVVWKPSSKVPLCAIAVQNICNEVSQTLGHPGIFSMFLPEKKAVAEAFVDDTRVSLLSFTGSSGVGKQVAVKVAARMGRSLLECSGNNALIIDESATLDLALPAAVFGAVGTAGQRCTTTRRLLVHEALYDRVKARLVDAYQQVLVGNPLDEDVLMGPLIDEDAVTNYIATLKRVQDRGGRILFGGQVTKTFGFFVEPTLIEVDQQYPEVVHETFAPILYMLKFQNIDEAIRLQNAVPQGLSSALFTNSIQNAELFLSAIGSDCGIANINIGTSGAEIGGAFGGEKETGGGREAGSDSWKAYMRRQTNTINWGNDLPLAQGIKFNL